MEDIQDFLTLQTASPANSWLQQGTGTLTWSVFSIYRASLWTLDSLHLVNNSIANQAFALRFEYLRTVTAEYILKASRTELQRLGHAPDQSIQQWQNALAGIMPDVVKGDIVWIIFQPGIKVSFFQQTTTLGEILDPAFCTAFASIWFDPDCHSKTLRSALLQKPAVR
ncbi:chalcone isomerase family protein [Methylobacillus gramineus]|uniref:chalcone isomerase family protein n=1 Tax=Methylobacillus gramineus TaxID=755169 RepID=UPI001D001A20|nr:chalcone isomerase family protein [Methylobacillus gramineus]MCB5185861.1 chalcone isomerase family protein [Methylobacillus gramineus]